MLTDALRRLHDTKISKRSWGSVHVVLSTSNIRVLTKAMIDDRGLYRFCHHGEAGGRQFDSARIAYSKGEGSWIRSGLSCQPVT